MKKTLLMLAVSALGAGSGVACDLCSVYAANQAHGDVGQGWFGGFAEQFTHFGTVQVEGHEVSDPSHQYLDSLISQLYAGYNFNSRLGVQLNVPLVFRNFKRPTADLLQTPGSESGLADISLLGTFVPYQKVSGRNNLIWRLLGGVKFPTGNTSRIREEFSESELEVPSGIHGHDLTLGSGSFDGIVGTSLLWRHDHFFASGGVQYAIRSEGDYHYQFANDLTWNAGPGAYVLLQETYSLSAQFVVSGEYKDKDTFFGAAAEDTGMTAVYVGPQFNFTWNSKLAAFAAVDVPVLLNNTSLQTVPDYRVRAGLSWHF